MMRGTDLNMELGERFANVQARIGVAAAKSGRSPQEITLIAISKTHPAAIVQELIGLGAGDLGENRVQEAEGKITQVGRTSARWHLVGHLQTNKARKALKLFDMIHSLDSVSLAQRLQGLCVEEGREDLPVLIQVDLAHEVTKSGIGEAALPQLVQTLTQCDRLRLVGLMTLPPFFENAEDARPFFQRLRKLRDELGNAGNFGNQKGELSMGMTHDFEVAIEEGATMVRIGTAIFGERGQHR
jgi:PLP dependent protein